MLAPDKSLSADSVVAYTEKIYKCNPRFERMTKQGGTYEIDVRRFQLLTAILPFELDKVELRTSKVHGRGVFAKTKINKGELITFYAGDIIEHTPNADRPIDNHIVLTYASERFEDKFGKEATRDKKFRDNNYALVLDPFYTIIGHPYFDKDPNYFGHFINDGAKSNSTIESDIIYQKISLLKENCQFYCPKSKVLHVPVIATKDIEIGEELFVHYGISYWQSYNKQK